MPKPKRQTENVHKLDFIFLGLAAEFQPIRLFILITSHIHNHMHCNLVIMEAIDGLSRETIVQLFYKNKTTDFCGTKPGATIKT